MNIKTTIENIKGNCMRFTLLLVAFLVICIVPLRMLIRRRPFRNYVFGVAYQWFKLCTHLLKACGARVSVNETLDPE